MGTLDKLIGTGLKFPYLTDSNGSIETSSMIDRINQSLLLIFETPKGSRLMLPDFGSDIHKYRFEPNDTVLQEQLRYSITEDISKWEPRINTKMISFHATPDIIDNNILYIYITYNILNTEIEGSFVYPFKTETYDTVEDKEESGGVTW